MKFYRAFITLVILVAAIGPTAACFGGSASWGRTFQGPILEVTPVESFTVPEVVYQEDDKNTYVIKPSTGNDLLVFHARIGNHAADVAFMDIDSQPAEITLASAGSVKSVNTAQVKQPFDGSGQHPSLNRYIPFVRGTQELEKGYELNGWLVFDVPKGDKLEQFKWEAGGDVIIIDF
ncbi:MAG: hypothetical protein FJ320_06840 [SAR202 cluster bacterium]|nr:hypothetical protein [SAR202 cluster bacterium]